MAVQADVAPLCWPFWLDGVPHDLHNSMPFSTEEREAAIRGLNILLPTVMPKLVSLDLSNNLLGGHITRLGTVLNSTTLQHLNPVVVSLRRTVQLAHAQGQPLAARRRQIH